MVKIAVTGGKGGTGKSMVATTLAVEWAKSKKTCLVDADAECPNDHLILNIKREKYDSIFQWMPEWNLEKCTKCGQCAQACKQDAIVFVKGKYPVFASDQCIGCGACLLACPEGAITESEKKIGTIYTGEGYGTYLISGELKLGELASGEVVAELREKGDKLADKWQAETMLIDSAAGIGCPVIASLKGTDFIVAVTEPTPSALHDLKRVLYLADHFKIPKGIVINKADLKNKFLNEITQFAKEKRIPILGQIPYSEEFLVANLEMKPVTVLYPKYVKLFKDLKQKINSFLT